VVRVQDGFADYVAASTGAVIVELRDTGDPDAAKRALIAARRALFAIPHPEEPDDPLPSFASEVEVHDTGASFRFDIADAESYDGLVDEVIAALVSAIETEGVDGTLGFPDSDLPDVATEQVRVEATSETLPVLRTLLRSVGDELRHEVGPPAGLVEAVASAVIEPEREEARRRAVIAWYITSGLPLGLDAVGLSAGAARLRELQTGDNVAERRFQAVCEVMLDTSERVRELPGSEVVGLLERPIANGRSLDHGVARAVGDLVHVGPDVRAALLDPAFRAHIEAQNVPLWRGAAWVAWQMLAKRVWTEAGWAANRAVSGVGAAWERADDVLGTHRDAFVVLMAKALVSAGDAGDHWAVVMDAVAGFEPWRQFSEILAADAGAAAGEMLAAASSSIRSAGPGLPVRMSRSALVTTASLVNETCRELIVARTVAASWEQLSADQALRAREEAKCEDQIRPIVRMQCEGALSLLRDLAAEP
jgi:hypothetical protein